jgi:ATP-dependent Clp protease ATP-binding subunit ClpA
MTTNAGSDRNTSSAGFSSSSAEVAEAKTEKALASFLRPEFINRVDEIITFRSLDKNDFASIARIMIGELATVLEEKDIRLECDDNALALIAEKSYSAKFGARNMRRFIQTEIEDKLAEIIISDYNRSFSAFVVSAENGELKISSK